MSELEPFRENTWLIVVTATDTEGEALDLNDYDECWFSVRATRTSETYLISPVQGTFNAPLSAGILSFRLEWTETDVAKGDYWYDVLLKKEGVGTAEDEYYTIAKDYCRIKGRITDPDDIGGS